MYIKCNEKVFENACIFKKNQPINLMSELRIYTSAIEKVLIQWQVVDMD